MVRAKFFRVFVCLLFLFLGSCGKDSVKEGEKWVISDLSGLRESQEALVRDTLLTAAGLKEEKCTPSLEMEGLRMDWVNKQVVLVLENESAHFSFLPTLLGIPQDLEGFSSFELSFSANADCACAVKLGVHGGLGMLEVKADAKAGSLKVEMSELPIVNNQAFKKDSLYYSIKKVSLSLSQCSKSDTLFLKAISLHKQMEPRGFIVDRFGQRVAGQWEGKITTAQDLKTQLSEEHAGVLISKSFAESKRTYTATGFFRVEKKADNFQLIAPNGQEFWSLGVTGVRMARSEVGATWVKGREHFFEALPDATTSDSLAYANENEVSFYAWNVLRKYEGKEEWMTHSLKRLSAWGMNTLGCWSDEDLMRKDSFPFTVYIHTRGNFAGGRIGPLPNVFHPEYEDFIRKAVTVKTEKYTHSKQLLGYFVDNEVAWYRLNVKDYPNDTTLCRVFEEVMKVKVEEASEVQVIEFMRQVALRYAKTIHEVVKQSDPNHLLLGCRFTRNFPPREVLEVLGKYTDVVSVNIYSFTPSKVELQFLHQATGNKPLLIGEHHVPLASPKIPLPRFDAFDATTREYYYRQYIRTLAKTPFVLGAHWYQWSDQDVMGRSQNGENQLWGLVDITDQGYQELINAIGQVRDSLWVWRE